ncbi:formate/nitrite transporter family protein [Kiritimatiellota bacterium B12222]|nr:formate/nitrite transporter family protein [Kiritimatiellota bacterium B12222]
MLPPTPAELVDDLIAAGVKKSKYPLDQLLIRGIYSGLLLGIATTLSVTVAVESAMPFLGALAFPVGFVMIMILGTELVTGNFAVLPMAYTQGEIKMAGLLKNWRWVIIGNFLGCISYAILFSIYISKFGHVENSAVIAKVIAIAEGKTLAYQKIGYAGLIVLLIKAIICNWMVSMGVVMAFVAKTIPGKIFAIWMPIFTFFALGLEHCIVNMFVIPAGMFLGADISIYQWLCWNQIPAIIGNIIGAMFLTGWFLQKMHGSPKSTSAASAEA